MPGQLTIEEREQIAHFRSQGLSRAEIARRLQRHPTTIGRELAWNRTGEFDWANAAHAKAQAQRQGRQKKLDNPALREFVQTGALQRWSPTFDNGKEFTDHQGLARATNLDVYYAGSYHARGRGSNENFNGLWRQFFPKGTDFTDHSPQGVKHVLHLLNDRPRKRLGYRTPREVLGQYFPIAFQW
jgi:IS30 family transposase